MNEGIRPRVLVRDTRKLERTIGRGLDAVQGTLPDQEATRQAVRGVDTVLHLAALATAYCPDPAQYMRDNACAVEVLFREAAAAGVRRIVHVSTIAALPASGIAVGRVSTGQPTPYASSKMAAEAVVRQYATSGPEAVIVRPTRVYGPGPWNDANGTTRMMALYLRGLFRFRPADGGVQANYVHVRDVATGILLAAKHGRNGMAYQLGGENSSLEGFLAAIGEVSGVQRRVWPVTPRLLSAAARAGSWWGRCGGRTSLTPAWLDYFLENRPADITTARRDLGYEPQNLRDGIAATLPWLLAPTEGGDRAHQLSVRRREAWA